MANGGKGGSTGGGLGTPLVSLPRGANGQPLPAGVAMPAPTATATGNAGAAQSPMGYSTNPMNNAALGFQDAFRYLQQAGGAMSPQFSGYSPVTGVSQAQQAATYQAPNAGPAATVNTPGAQAVNYQAYVQQDPQTIASQMGRYQNPYEDQVVQNTARQMQDALRQTQMANADAAIASGAFGGGRHGVVEGVSNAQAVKDIGDMTAALRAQGFDTAAGLAGQDVANRMQVGALNQQALNDQRAANAGAHNSMRQFNAGMRSQEGTFNAGQQNQMRQFNAGLQENAGQFNANARNNMSQFNESSRAAMEQFNAGAHNAARQFNSTGQYGARQDYLNNLMGLSSQFGNLSQASYGVGRSIAGDQMQSGSMSQQLMQQLLQAGQSGYDQITGQPERLLQLRLAALGMNPLNNATTTTGTTQTNPGWGATFGNMLGAAGNMFQFNPISLPFGRG